MQSRPALGQSAMPNRRSLSARTDTAVLHTNALVSEMFSNVEYIKTHKVWEKKKNLVPNPMVKPDLAFTMQNMLIILCARVKNWTKVILKNTFLYHPISKVEDKLGP